jgi:hypothetical protein
MRIYKFLDLPMEREQEMNEWLTAQENVAVSYSYFREGTGAIVSVFQIDFFDPKTELLFDLKFSDVDSYNRH